MAPGPGCGRQLGEGRDGQVGLQTLNAFGDFDDAQRVVSLAKFGVVDFCTFEYKGGPGFAISAIQWLPYTITSRVLPDDPRFDALYADELRKEIDYELGPAGHHHHKH